MKHCVIHLNMSSFRHPQTDRACKIMKIMIGNYLRCFGLNNLDDCYELLPASDFSYNSAITEDIGIAPFQLDNRSNFMSALNFVTGYEISIEGVDNLKKSLTKSLNNAHHLRGNSKAKQSTNISQNYKPHNFCSIDVMDKIISVQGCLL